MAKDKIKKVKEEKVKKPKPSKEPKEKKIKEPKAKKEKAPKLPKEKTVSTKKAAKLEKFKAKYNLRNFKTTSSWLITFIIATRIALAALVLITPIVISFAMRFDDGLFSLVKYILYSMGVKAAELLSTTFNITNWLPIICWVLFSILLLFMALKPFVSRKTAKKRLLLGVRFIVFAIIFILIPTIIYLIIPSLPNGYYDMNGGIAPEAPNEEHYLYYAWRELMGTFDPVSVWMIWFYIIHTIFIFFGIWLIVESKLIKRNILKYKDFLVNEENTVSVAQGVLAGHLEFGQHDDEDLRARIKNLKGELSQDQIEELARKAEAAEKNQTIDAKALIKENKRKAKLKKQGKNPEPKVEEQHLEEVSQAEEVSEEPTNEELTESSESNE